MLDYLTWRGDLTFAQDPFNCIDALLLSCLSYVNFDNVIPSGADEYITIEDASKSFFELHSEEELAQDKSFINYGHNLLRSLAESERFKDARLSNFVDDTDISREIQFAAVEIDTSDGVSFISFRGTDDTVVGWKEDFNLSYMTVPAEDEAVLYLKKVTAGRTNMIRIGGHSKGGHLAVYAATADEPELGSRVETIYNFDGPGFNHEAMESVEFKHMQPKIIKVTPESSIVGRLLTNSTEPLIVKSTELGIMQHDPLTWQLEGKNFVLCDFTDKISDLFDETMTKWLGEMSFEERKVFVDELFSVFEASGCGNLSMMTKVGVKGTKAMIERMREIRNDSGVKIRTLMKMFFINFNVLRDNVVKERFEDGTKKIAAVAGKNKKGGKQ